MTTQMQNINNLDEDQLQEVIRSANRALLDRQKAKRRGVEAYIRKLAESIGMTCVLAPTIAGGQETPRLNRMKGVRVKPKYSNPNNANETWTGRGVTPKWLSAMEGAGHSREEFLIQ